MSTVLATTTGARRVVHDGSYLPTLDGWRAIAILLVLVDHAGDEILGALRLAGVHPAGFTADGAQQIKENIGLFGVHIFFALSGYLITSRLMKESMVTSINLWHFYLRRLFRIQPAALTYLAVVGLLGVAALLPVSLGSWMSALLCYANLHTTNVSWYTGHFWSLSIEEHFYLIWPATFVLLGDRNRLAGALALTLALALWKAVALKWQIAMTDGWIVRTDMQAEYLMWGCTAAIMQGSSRWAPLLKRLTGPGVCALGILIMIAGALLPIADWKVQHIFHTGGAAATALVLLATTTHAETWLSRCLELRPLTWIGRFSYSLYLWQQLFFAWNDKRAPALGVLQTFPLNLAAAGVMAVVSYFCVEQPAIRLGRRVIRRLRAHGDMVRDAPNNRAQDSALPPSPSRSIGRDG